MTLPKMNITMRLSAHDQWLKKIQALSYKIAGPLISLLMKLNEGKSPAVGKLQRLSTTCIDPTGKLG